MAGMTTEIMWGTQTREQNFCLTQALILLFSLNVNKFKTKRGILAKSIFLEDLSSKIKQFSRYIKYHN